MPEPAIVVCDLERGVLAPPLTEHKRLISALALSPDGRLLASAAMDQSLRLWETMSGQTIHLWPKQPSAIAALAFSPDGRTLALADGSPSKLVSDLPETPRIRLLDVVSGREIAHREGHQAEVRFLAFSPDGKRLASVQGDSTVLIWDLSSLSDAENRKPLELDRAVQQAAWDDLASLDAAKASGAVWKLVAAPHQATTFLQERLRPIQAIETETIRRWVAALDSDDFTAREAAVRKLSAADRQVEPELRRTLTRKPSLEMRRRVEDLLHHLAKPASGETPRVLRAIAVLEYINSARTRQLLGELAGGAPAARETQAAKEALQRLAN